MARPSWATPLGMDRTARSYSARDFGRVSAYSCSIVGIAFTSTCRSLGDKTLPPKRPEPFTRLARREQALRPPIARRPGYNPRMGEDRRPRVPESLQEPFRSALVAAADVWIEREGLISIVLFGSVARRQAGLMSDIDVLLVAEGLPRSLADRRRPFLEAWQGVRAARRLSHVEWNLVVKTPDEARVRSPLYLDVVEDGILILDRQGLFEEVLAGMRARMRELGSRRIHLADGTWYWDLKPDFRFGDVVEI